MMKKTIIITLVILSILGTSCAQAQVADSAPIKTKVRLPTVEPSATPIPTPTNIPDPGMLETAKTMHFGPVLAAKYASQNTSIEDDEIINAVENQEIYLIDGLLFDNIEGYERPEGAPINAPAYVLVDEDTDDGKVVAWYDINTNLVVETSTGYPLNVRSAPGIGITAGANGEEFYSYGFAWYPRWERILPEPVIKLLDDFYNEGIDHVQTNIEKYQLAADPDYFGGELNLVSWDEDLLAVMEMWGPDLGGAPFMPLPDSGTVDLSSESFQKAIDNGLIIIDQNGLDQYLLSDFPKNSTFNINQSQDSVTQVLLKPFQSPNSFSDLQKLIINGIIYDGRGSLTLVIDFDLEGGYFVPASGEKVVKIAPREIDLTFGYDGLYFSKIPHELSHSFIYNKHSFLAESCLPNEDDIVETFSYLLEFMWWVQQYPGNAPSWGWETINSGLILARMLNGIYYNFGC